MIVMKNRGYPIAGMSTPHDGEYLKDMDFEAYDGRGHLVTTPDKADAKRFADPGEAFAFYKRVPECHPLRDDLQPNRPLTAFNWEFEQL